MMEVVFYDRKNKKEVYSSALMSIKLAETRLVVDSGGYRSGEWNQRTQKSYLKEGVIGEIGYKSEKCDKHLNWDRHLMQSDLVFLRLEEK